MPRTTKGHNYVNFHEIPSKSNQVPNQHIKFQDPSLNNLSDKVKMPRTAQGRNCINYPQNSFKISVDNLHIIPTHYTKFQEPKSNTF